MKNLINSVLAIMEQDFLNKDHTAIEELLKSVPRENLIAFLPEEMQDQFPQSINFITEED